MKIVLDTNIIFSALLNPKGKISDLLLNSFGIFDFYSPTFVLEELKNHQNKLLKISGYSEKDLDFLLRIVFKKIELIDVINVQQSIWDDAFKLTQNLDEFDIPFIALSLELDAPLWTGDKKLINGLKEKHINWLLTTDTVLKIRTEL